MAAAISNRSAAAQTGGTVSLPMLIARNVLPQMSAQRRNAVNGPARPPASGVSLMARSLLDSSRLATGRAVVPGTGTPVGSCTRDDDGAHEVVRHVIAS